MVLVTDLLLDFSHFRREEFDGGSALGANHMVMIAAIVLVLIASDTVVKGNLAGQATAGEKLKRPVNRGETDAVVFLLDEAVQFVGREMLTRFQERAQDGIALLGLLQANAAQMPEEDFLSFADVLPRDTRLIVDAFL